LIWLVELARIELATSWLPVQSPGFHNLLTFYKLLKPIQILFSEFACFMQNWQALDGFSHMISHTDFAAIAKLWGRSTHQIELD
jgi:hypothetical protein